jgi:sugar lactone lactonase YvrE
MNAKKAMGNRAGARTFQFAATPLCSTAADNDQLLSAPRPAADKIVRAPARAGVFLKQSRKARFVAGALALAVSLVARAQSLSIHTLAGAAAPGSTNGFGSNARFNHLTGVTTDSAGNVFVADTGNSTIRQITPDGNVSTFVGLAGNFGSADGSAANARFYGPQAIAASPSGQLFVADSANSTIRRVTSAGQVTTFAGAAGVANSLDGLGASARFYHPETVAVDQAGNLYVADSWNHTIRRLTSGGLVSTLAGLAGYAGAADGTNSKARFNRPGGIALDATPNLFVADTFNHIIRKITPAGMVSTIAGLPGVWGSADGTNGAARFYLPQGIGVAPNGDIFVSDSGNQTLRRISLIGTNWVVTTVAGANGLAGNSNGVGSNANFSFPAGLVFDTAGYLYLADTANNTVRTARIVPPTLQFANIGNQLILSWPVSSDGFVLEQTATLGASASWSVATNSVVSLGDNFTCTNSLLGTAYYRLHSP